MSQNVITLLVALLGSPAVTSIAVFLTNRWNKHKAEDLEDAIANSPSFRRLELELYRQTLFTPTTSRAQHEHQLEVGRTYLTLGGNGSGHVRLTQLEDDYRRRLDSDDWRYPSL